MIELGRVRSKRVLAFMVFAISGCKLQVIVASFGTRVFGDLYMMVIGILKLKDSLVDGAIIIRGQ